MSVLLLIIVAAVLFLLFLGVYGDMAKRTGFPISSRASFILAPILYAITILMVFLPVVFFVFFPLFLMDLNNILRLTIPLGIATFGLLVSIGAIPLWLLHRKTVGFKKCMILSARLMLSPFIDAFWASATVFVGALLAIPAFFISSLISAYQGLQYGADIGGLVGYVFSPRFSQPFIIVFILFGLLSAYFILKRGPSEVVSKYFFFSGIGVLGASILAAVFLLSIFGQFSWILVAPVFMAGVSLCITCLFLSSLFKALRIAGVFGLTIALLSILVLALVYVGTQFLSGVPIVGSIILEIIPPALWTAMLEIGVVGIASGIIIIVLARRTEEREQVMTRAMAISVGVSSFMPLVVTSLFRFLDLGFLSGLLGAMAGVLLTFLLIGPIYIITVCILRLVLAIRIIAKPPD
jgi:hypothetical protein